MRTPVAEQLTTALQDNPKHGQIRPLCDLVYILEPTSVDRGVHKAVTLSNEYGKSKTPLELKQLLQEQIGYRHVEICQINLDNYKEQISRIKAQSQLKHNDDESSRSTSAVVVNLCDGCESDGYPGLSILQLLSDSNLAFTGSTPDFYKITTSKPELKAKLLQCNVSTSPYLEIDAHTTELDIKNKFSADQFPLIVKPSVSYASLSITDKSVVHSAREALDHARSIQDLSDIKSDVESGSIKSVVFVEQFLAGREYTVFVTGSREEGVRVFEAAERVFNPQLEKYQRILAFDRYWAGYDLEGNVPAAEAQQSVYWYALAEAKTQPMLKRLASDAYLALDGSGYGRVDIRTPSMESDQGVVLEVNANCGVSFNPMEFTSTVGEILRMSGESVEHFANELIAFALKRHQNFTKI